MKVDYIRQIIILSVVKSYNLLGIDESQGLVK